MGNDSPIRMTLQRQAVLEVVRASRDHPTAMEIFERVRARYPHVAYSTVYTALNALVDAGLVTELRIGKHPTRYDGRTEHHHHALCEGCGQVVEIEGDLCQCQVAVIHRLTGFQVRQVRVELRGLCPACQGEGGKESGEGHGQYGNDAVEGHGGGA